MYICICGGGGGSVYTQSQSYLFCNCYIATFPTSDQPTSISDDGSLQEFPTGVIAGMCIL